MKYFTKLPILFSKNLLEQSLKEVLTITDFPKVITEHPPLKPPIELNKNKVYYQIALTRRNQEPEPDCFYINNKGDNLELRDSDIGVVENVNEIDDYHKEFEYDDFIPAFRHTYFHDVYNQIKEYMVSMNFMLGRARLRLSNPLTTLSWHTDDQANVHIPIITSPESRIVIEDEMLHMPAGECWVADVTHGHTQFNASKDIERVHMVIVIKEIHP